MEKDFSSGKLVIKESSKLDTETTKNINSYIDKIKKYYEKDPGLVEEELVKTIERIESNSNGVSSGFVNEEFSNNFNKILMAIEIITIICLGIPVILKGGETAMMYYFGLLFMIAGLFIGLYVKIFGLIFLLSHGCTGMGLMISSMVGGNSFFSRVTDLSSTDKLSLEIGIIALILAFLGTVLHNLLNSIKEKKYSANVILGFLIIGIIALLYFGNFIG